MHQGYWRQKGIATYNYHKGGKRKRVDHAVTGLAAPLRNGMEREEKSFGETDSSKSRMNTIGKGGYSWALKAKVLLMEAL